VPETNPSTKSNGLAALGISTPWATPWNKPKIPTIIIISNIEIFFSITIPNPRRITDIIIPVSIIIWSLIGKINPINPPIAIMHTKVAGTVQIAMPPIYADKIPTLIIAKKWSNPKTRWEIPS